MIIAQIIGFIALIFAIKAYLQTNRDKFLYFKISSGILLILHYYLYDKLSATLICLISIIIMVLSLYLKQTYLKLLKIISPFLGVIVYFYLDEGIYGLLPSIGIFLSSIASLQSNTLYMKYFYIICSVNWIIFSILINSPVMIIYDIVSIMFLIYGIKKERFK